MLNQAKTNVLFAFLKVLYAVAMLFSMVATGNTVAMARQQKMKQPLVEADSAKARKNIEKAKTLFDQPKIADSLGTAAFKLARQARRPDLQGHAAFIVCFSNLVNNRNMPKAMAWGDSAMYYFNKAGNHLWSGYVGRNLGIQLNAAYKFESGIRYLNRSSKSFELAGDSIMLAYNYASIALAFHDFRDYVNGKRYSNMAVQIAERHKKATPELKWKAYNTLAINYDDNNEPEKALSVHFKNIANARDDGALSSTYNNIGNTYLKLKKYQPADEYFTKSLEKNKTNMSKYQFATLYTNLSRINLELGKMAAAKAYLEEALLYAKSSQSTEKILDAYYVAFLVNNKSGAHKSAADFLSQYTSLKDSLINVDNAKVLLDMQTKYETEKKQQQILLLNKENQIQGLELGKQLLENNNKSLLLEKNGLEIKKNKSIISQKQLEAAAKTQRIKLLDAENEVQKLALLKRNVFIGIIAGVLILSVFAGVLFYNRYRLRQENKLQEAIIKQQDLATKAILNAEENERKRISGELHDGLGQMFSAVKLNLSGIADGIHFKDPETREVFEKTIGIVDESCREVRVISHQMAPNVLLKSGLATAVRDFIDKIDERKLKVKLETFGLRKRLDQNVETVLYRVIQETVNNVIKHAGANTLDIQLSRDEEGINVMIEDNGKGFDVAQADKFQGIGLKNIKSRIEYLKGTVDFSSALGKGTLVAIFIPH